MARRPSLRRSKASGLITINLIPMLDALVTIIAFLLFGMSFLAIVSIESPVPITSQKIVNEKLQQKPLQLTLTIRPEEVEIWSPFNRFKSQTFKNNPDGQIDLVNLHDALVAIKERFPYETQLVLVPFATATYDLLIAIMDSARYLDDGDPPIFIKDKKSGIDLAVEVLFPEIVFGNLLGDS